MIEASTPLSRPSPRSKPSYTRLLTSFHKKFTKVTHKAWKHQTPKAGLTARQSRLGYSKGIKRAKAVYWSDFLAKTSSNNLSTANQCVIISKTPRFPSLPGISDPVSINKAPLDYFFPHKDPLPQRDRRSRDPSPPPPCEAEIKLVLSMPFPTCAPSPDRGPPTPCRTQLTTSTLE